MAERKSGNPVYEVRFMGCGMSLQGAARWLGIHPTTLHRQENGEVRPSGAVLKALYLKAGFLGGIHPDWKGWRLFEDGRLYHEGLRIGYTPGEIEAMWYVNQERAALRARIRELEEKLVLFTSANDSVIGSLVGGK